ncbi:cytochrome c biogenesis protein ResB [Sphaerisporangium sp. NPDC049003]|uniref:cytochrome c biogenesis protein ResB n=1 Tax=Sphaerisporangium sp. NPDC049003 TaxID=3364517 RepID=UPI003723B7FF
MTFTQEVRADPAGPAGLGPLGWLRWAWRLLTSMRTALILLFLFALASVPGSIYPQRSISPEKVAQYFKDSPGVARWLDRLGLFDVFTSPWFAATYLLLFLSLAGCVIPRAAAHLREVRRTPPAAPRNLSRLPQHASFEAPGATVESIAAQLRKKRFRTVTGPGWVSAEKGYLRETGNLLFHVALLALLVAVGAGGLYGYRGNVLLVEGNGFANTVAAYDRYIPGQNVSAESLEPFSFTLSDFQATYVATGDRRGQPLDFSAKLRVTDRPGARERPYDLRVNEPLDVNGTQTYLLGHGYAPTFKILDGKGQVAFEGPVPCLTADQVTYTSECVIKVPDAVPDQLGFLVRFLPTTVPAQDGSYVSVFPGAANPTAQVFAFSGDLGMKSGRPQSVYQLDTKNLKPLVMGLNTKPLAIGETLPLPGGAGSIQLTGVREWISLQIAYDPGRIPALIAAGLSVLGLVLSLTVRRRRVWARVKEGEGATEVEVGGLTRTEGGPGFAEEFSQIVTALRGPEAGDAASRQGVKDAH